MSTADPLLPRGSVIGGDDVAGPECASADALFLRDDGVSEAGVTEAGITEAGTTEAGTTEEGDGAADADAGAGIVGTGATDVNVTGDLIAPSAGCGSAFERIPGSFIAIVVLCKWGGKGSTEGKDAVARSAMLGVDATAAGTVEACTEADFIVAAG